MPVDVDDDQLTQRFEEALIYALRLHAGQVRKGGGTPYFAHLISVAALVIEDGGDEDEAIAALLHDAIEDQGGAEVRDEIRQRFGERVAAIVDGCTDAETIPKPPWRARKERYVASLADASPAVIRVEAADKLHNARSILRDYRRLGESLWSRFSGGREGTLWYYREMTRILQQRTDSPLVVALDEVVTTLEHLVRQT
jgi:GTP pyrophosphokinase